jgi:serine/threonine protein kinase
MNQSFHRLHADGLCYRDISWGNAFFDPATGDVLICDNDNVSENRSGIGGVLGTPDFMAPEIVRMEGLPSRQTDLFSLAVLLFLMLHISHPLVGKRVLAIRMFDYPARKQMFGKAPLFIFDPQDKSNEAVDRKQDPTGEAGDNALRYWPIYPSFLRELFTRTFTSGLFDAEHGRVTEGEWKIALARLRDSLFPCSNCKLENFWEVNAATNSAAYGKQCWNCRKTPTCPPRLRIGKEVILLHVNAKLYPHHVDDSSEFGEFVPVADIVHHPSDHNVLGLRNKSAQRWVATFGDGSVNDVENGKSVVVAAGTKVRFGRTSGEFLM